MKFLFAALLAMSATILLIPLLKRWSVNLGVLDQPNERKVHAQPIPRIGGISMCIAMLMAIGIFGESSIQLKAYIYSVVVLLIFGFIDDRLTLSSGLKFFGQFAAALILILLGEVNISHFFIFADVYLPSWVSMPFTLLIIVGVTNALNLSDGLDGLAGGAALMSLSGLLLLALTSNDLVIALPIAVLIGSILGFLRFNTFPAQVFMGDAGSQVIGLSLVFFSICITQNVETAFSSSLPLLILGVPVIDMLGVMVQRLYSGKSPFVADRNHLHHLLLNLGLKHYQAVVVIYSLQSILLIIAWVMRYESDLYIISIFIVFLMAVLIPVRVMNRQGWSILNLGFINGLLSKYEQRSGSKNFIEKNIGNTIALCMLAYGLLLLINGVTVNLDVSMLALFLALVLLVSKLIKRLPELSAWLEKAVLYVAAFIAVSHDQAGFLSHDLKFVLECIIFGLIFFAIAFRLFVFNKESARMSTMDVLVMIAALILPNLPGSILSGYTAGVFVTKILLLLYGIENIQNYSIIKNKVFTYGIFGFLGILGFGFLY